MSDSSLLDAPFRPMGLTPPGQLSLPMLKSWLSSYGYPSTTAGPIVATTITIEAIQDLLHANGFPIEAPCNNVDMYTGPFDDTQFDAVVDVETCNDGMDTELKFTDLDTCSEYGYCGSDFSEDDMNLFQDLTLSPDSPLLSDSADIDFGCDSGIEAEMDEPRDGAENEKEKKEKSKSSDDKKSSKDSNQEGTDVSQQQDASKPQTKNKKPDEKTSRKTEEDEDEEDDENKNNDDNDDDHDLPHFNCQYLWEFLHHILLEKHNKYIVWKNQTKGVFRLIDHNGLARLWGRQKNRKNMTYEKLSRALRYYYSKNILRKVPGQRLTYKFVRNLHGKKYPL